MLAFFISELIGLKVKDHISYDLFCEDDHEAFLLFSINFTMVTVI